MGEETEIRQSIAQSAPLIRARPVIAVAGAGAIGLSLAWALARRGAAVAVFDKGAPGRGALWASGGMLAAGFESALEGPAGPGAQIFADFARRSLALWDDWARRLADGGAQIGHERFGSIAPAYNPADAARLEAALAFARRLDIAAEGLTGLEARAREPALAEPLSALWFPGDGQVDNRALGPALIAAIKAAGGRVRGGLAVTGLEIRQGRVCGVRLGEGSTLACDAVVLASGAAAPIADLGDRPAVEPVKGQMLALKAERPAAPRAVVRSLSVYIAAKSRSRVVIGATREPGRVDLATDEAAIERLASAARRIAPGLQGAPEIERWAGLRPALPGGLPRIGPGEAEGLFLALGHYRNGVLLAPATAEALSRLILQDDASALPAAFASPNDAPIRRRA